MMKMLIVLSLMSIYLHEVYLQDEHYGLNMEETPKNGPSSFWPFQVQGKQGNYYNGIVRKHRKPCTRRHNPENPIMASQWIPTFTSRVVKPLVYDDKANLKPQSLKYDEYNSAESNVLLRNAQKENTVPITDSSREYVLKRKKPARSISTYKNNCNPKPDSMIDSSEEILDTDDIKTIYEDKVYKLEKKVSTVETDNNEPINKCGNKNESPSSLGNVNDNSRRYLANNPDKMWYLPKPGVNEKQKGNGFNLGSSLPKNKVPVLNDDSDVENRYFQNRKVKTEQPLVTKKNNIEESKVPAERYFGYDMNLRPQGVANQRIEPTKGLGISDMMQSKVVLMENPRICYACSSASDQTCWNPDRRTTLKYCRKGRDACLSKTYTNENSLVIIRDCGTTCVETSISGVTPEYKSCSICHSDFCNSACSINSRTFIAISITVSLYKYFF